jgi:phosphatidate cytidylyltransferase
MIAFFFWLLSAGHIYIIIIVTAVQVISFKEVIAIANVPSRARSLRFTKSLNWYFLGTAMYYLYGESVIYYFKHILLVDRILLPLATHHRFISFMMYMIGFVFFVYSLQKGHYKFQFTQFAWTHMALFLIVGQAHFVINNIFEGLIWFILPVSMVICNDIWAYICGITFGRTPLIQISPKKTWEGFLGAWFFTVIWGVILSHYLSQYKYFICPVNDLGANIWSGLECKPNPVFIARNYTIPFLPAGLPLPRTFNVMPVQFHIFILRVRAEADVQDQGLWRLHSWTRRHDRSYGLPVHHGIDCLLLLLELHCCIPYDRWRSHRGSCYGLNTRGANGGCEDTGKEPGQPGHNIAKGMLMYYAGFTLLMLILPDPRVPL